MGDGCVVIYACGEKKGLGGEGEGAEDFPFINNRQYLISMNQYYLRISFSFYPFYWYFMIL